MRLCQATQLTENCNVMRLHAVRQFSPEHCIMFGHTDQESRLAVLDSFRRCCPESCQLKHEREIWCSTAALLWDRLLQKRVGAKRPPCIVHVEEMVAMLIVVCKYLGASVDAATLKSVRRSICNSLGIPIDRGQVLQWERLLCMFWVEALTPPDGTQFAFAIGADACGRTDPLVRLQGSKGWPGHAISGFDQPPQEGSWPHRAALLIGMLVRNRPDLAYVCNGTVASACDLALAALALTADGFGCVPLEVAAFIQHVGRRLGTGTWTGLAHTWGCHLHVAVPMWLQPPRLACGLVTHPKLCKDAFRVSRTITVQGFITGQSMLLGVKRVETRGFRLQPGWWNLHVGARDTPESVAHVARATGFSCVDDGAPKSAILGRFLVVGVLPTSTVPDCWALEAFGRFCSIIGETITFATPFPCRGRLGPWQVSPALLSQMDTAMLQATHRHVNLDDLALPLCDAGRPATTSRTAPKGRSRKKNLDSQGAVDDPKYRRQPGLVPICMRAMEREGHLEPARKMFRGLDDCTCRVPRSAVGAVPCIFVTSDSTPLERNDVQTVQSQSEQREAHCKITENVVHPRRYCVGAGAPLHIEGRQHGLDMGSPIEVAKQDLAMRQRPGNSRHRPGHQIPTGAGKEFHMSKDDTKQAGIMFASGHFLMHRAHWREKKVRRRAFCTLDHVWQNDLEMLCPDIVEETDTIAYGIGCRETVLRQLNLFLQKLRAKGVQQQGHTHLLKRQSSGFARKLQTMRRSGHFCDLTLVCQGMHVRCHRCVILPFLQLSGRAPVGKGFGRTCKIELQEYNANALAIVIEHVYGMDVTALLEKAPPGCLPDVFRLGTTWDLPALVALTAHILGLHAERQGTAALRSILGVIRDILPCPPEAIN